MSEEARVVAFLVTVAVLLGGLLFCCGPISKVTICDGKIAVINRNETCEDVK